MVNRLYLRFSIRILITMMCFVLPHCSSPTSNNTEKNGNPLFGTWIGDFDSTGSTSQIKKITFSEDGAIVIQSSSGNYSSQTSGTWYYKGNFIVINCRQNSPYSETVKFGFDASYEHLFLEFDNGWECYTLLDTSFLVNPELEARKNGVIRLPVDTTAGVLDTIEILAEMPDSVIHKYSKFVWCDCGKDECDTTTTPVLRKVFGIDDTGMNCISFVAIDFSGQATRQYFMGVNVHKYRPWVLTTDTILFHLNDSIELKADAYDTNGTIVKYYWSKEDDSAATVVSTSNTICLPLKMFGSYKYEIVAEDNSGLKSPVSTCVVIVTPHTYANTGNDQGRSVVECTNGDLAVCGQSNSGSMVLRTNSSGILKWRKYYSENGLHLNQIIALPDGGTALIGSGNGAKMIYIVLNADGTERLVTNIESTYNEYGYGLALLPCGDLVVCGYRSLENYVNKGVVHRISPTGVIKWSNTFSYTDDVENLKIVALDDNSAIVGGSMWVDVSGGVESECFLTRVDLNSGAEVWTKDIWSRGVSDNPFSLSIASDGSILVSTIGYGDGWWNMMQVYDYSTDGYNIKFAVIGQQTSFESSIVVECPDGHILAACTPEESSETSIVDFTTAELGDRVYPSKEIKGSIYAGCRTSDNHVVFTGKSTSPGSKDEDVMLIKTDEKGEVVW